MLLFSDHCGQVRAPSFLLAIKYQIKPFLYYSMVITENRVVS
jgi:hypothetical protein